MSAPQFTLLQSRLSRLAEDLESRAMTASAALIREAIRELGELQHDIDVSNELLSGVLISRGPNFPEASNG